MTFIPMITSRIFISAIAVLLPHPAKFMQRMTVFVMRQRRMRRVVSATSLPPIVSR